MPRWSFKLDMSIEDVSAMVLRRQKRCLSCEAPVARQFTRQYVGEAWKSGRDESPALLKFKTYTVSAVYTCTACESEYKPREFW